ncbi:hypothetical protein [Streptomyces olivochromogenes]|uniref:hypothetical protein n=1 Tax=Streptomyces olivochromogenes TaxID=1963 RepID=UPI003699008A
MSQDGVLPSDPWSRLPSEHAEAAPLPIVMEELIDVVLGELGVEGCIAIGDEEKRGVVA